MRTWQYWPQCPLEVELLAAAVDEAEVSVVSADSPTATTCHVVGNMPHVVVLRDPTPSSHIGKGYLPPGCVALAEHIGQLTWAAVPGNHILVPDLAVHEAKGGIPSGLLVLSVHTAIHMVVRRTQSARAVAGDSPKARIWTCQVQAYLPGDIGQGAAILQSHPYQLLLVAEHQEVVLWLKGPQDFWEVGRAEPVALLSADPLS